MALKAPELCRRHRIFEEAVKRGGMSAVPTKLHGTT